MDTKQNKKLVPLAKELRRNMTPEERHLWYDFLRDYPARFQRQKILGRYIADFYCASVKLVIELDGSQHYLGDGPAEDEARSDYLKRFDITVIRIPNNMIRTNFSGVCTYIDHAVRELRRQRGI